MRSRSWRTTNDGNTVLHVETWVDAGLQEFLEDAAALSRAGGITRRALPRSIDGLLQAAVMAHQYRDMVTLLAPLPPRRSSAW